MGHRFRKNEFRIIAGLFVVDLLSPFLPVASTVLLLAATFRPSYLKRIAAIALEISDAD